MRRVEELYGSDKSGMYCSLGRRVLELECDRDKGVGRRLSVGVMCFLRGEGL